MSGNWQRAKALKKSGWYNTQDDLFSTQRVYVSQDDRKKQYCFTKSINRSPFKWAIMSMFHIAFFSSVIDKYQQMHFFTFNTLLV